MYSTLKQSNHANSITLLALYCILFRKIDAQKIIHIVKNVRPQPVTFRDIGFGPCPYGVTVEDLCNALTKALDTAVFKKDIFNWQQYQVYQQPENGNITEVLLGKLFASPSPVDP